MNLNLDSAELTQGLTFPIPCDVCKKSLGNAYYESNGKVTCLDCVESWRKRFGTDKKPSLLSIVLRAAGMAYLCGLAYWFLKGTASGPLGGESILIAYLIGWTVRAYSKHQGGIKIQAVAVIFTWMALIFPLIPEIVKASQQSHDSTFMAQTPWKPVLEWMDMVFDRFIKPLPTPLRFLSFYGLLLVSACGAPFLQGMRDPIDIVTMLIALGTAAWMNREKGMDFAGPFALRKDKRAAESDCRSCNSELTPILLACPSCGVFTKTPLLLEHAAKATAFEQATDWKNAILEWRHLLNGLPALSLQADQVRKKIQDTVIKLKSTASASLRRLPFEVAHVFYALVRDPWAAFSFVLSLVIYSWSTNVFVAAILLGLIFIHEAGHFLVMSRFGNPPRAPIFVPGMGAFVRSTFIPAGALEDARVGLAGPAWGGGAVLLLLPLYGVWPVPILRVIILVGAALNLINLFPLWPFDGSKCYRAIGQRDRWIIAALLLLLLWAFKGKVLTALAIGGILRLWDAKTAGPSDPLTRWTYIGLVLSLATIRKFL